MKKVQKNKTKEKFQSLPKSTKTELKIEVYKNLRHQIITNQIHAGQRLVEQDLIDQYGIGKTPLREIYQELKRDELIEIIPQFGTRVVTLDIQTLKEVVQVRKVLEGLCAELASQNISSEEIDQLSQILEKAKGMERDHPDSLKILSQCDINYHQIIYRAAQNNQLTKVIQSLLYKMSMFWFQSGFSMEDFRKQFEDLEELMQALKERNAPKAKKIMERHIDHFLKLVKKQIF
jgi:DNA-binding GntR family transcriptional regulator